MRGEGEADEEMGKGGGAHLIKEAHDIYRDIPSGLKPDGPVGEGRDEQDVSFTEIGHSPLVFGPDLPEQKAHE